VRGQAEADPLSIVKGTGDILAPSREVINTSEVEEISAFCLASIVSII
jgi:hypothetical protein